MERRQRILRVLLNGLPASALATLVVLATATVQAHRARRRYGGAPPAVPVIDTVVRPAWEVFADGRPLELVALGDSAMAGVGVGQLSETLPVQVATRAAAATGRPVHVVSHAVSGARTADVLNTQVRRVAGRPDVVMLLVGTNDVTHFAPRRALGGQTTALLAALNRLGAPVVMSSLPEFRAMRAIPWLVRLVLAREAAGVRKVQSRAASAAPDVVLVDVRSMVGKHFVADVSNLSADRFHPSAAGYRLIGEALSPMVIANMMTPERTADTAMIRLGTHRAISKRSHPRDVEDRLYPEEALAQWRNRATVSSIGPETPATITHSSHPGRLRMPGHCSFSSDPASVSVQSCSSMPIEAIRPTDPAQAPHDWRHQAN